MLKEDEQDTAPAIEPGGQQLTIDLNAADEADAEADAEAEAAAEARSGKPPRRRSQWRELKESHAKEIGSLRQQIDELKQRGLAPPAPVPQPAPRRDEEHTRKSADEEKIDELWKLQQRTLATLRTAQLPEEAAAELANDWRKWDRQRRALEAKVDNPPAQESDPYAYGREILAAEFPEVFAHSAYRKMAEAELELLILQHRKPHNIATAREAAQRVMQSRGLGKKTPPAASNAERARHVAVSGRAGAATAGADGGQYAPSRFILSLARAYTAHMPGMTDEERYRHWRRNVGKKEGLVP